MSAIYLTIYVTNSKTISKRQSKYFRQEEGRFLFEKRLNSDKGWFALFPRAKIFLKPLRVANASEATLEARRLKEEIDNLQLVASRDSRGSGVSTPREISRAVRTWLWITGADETLSEVTRTSELTAEGGAARQRLDDIIDVVTDTYRTEGGIGDYLSPLGAGIFEALNTGVPQVLMSNTLDIYIRATGNTSASTKDKPIADLQRWITRFISIAGDKPIDKITRKDVELFIETRTRDSKTGTVRRELGSLSSAWNHAARDTAVTVPNPFAHQIIFNEGLDKEKRNPFTQAQLLQLYAACKQKDDDIRWLLALMIETGARVSEVAGLTLQDLVLDVPVPYMNITHHRWRRIKTDGSDRKVPLVGATLWAAKRIHATAVPNQKFAFPRYTNDLKCKSSSASAIMVAFIRSQKIDHVTHELRHSIEDRLRNVGCPKEIRYAIDGHVAQDVGDTYGYGFGLKILKQWLDQIALP
jgi:integrase